MERRAFIAIALCFLILILYQEILQRLYPAPEEAPPQTREETAPGEEPAARAEPAPAGAARTEPGHGEPDAGTAAAQPPPAGRDVVIENELYRAVFTTAGARLKSLQLKSYRTSVAPGSPPLDLIEPSPATQPPLGLLLRGSEGAVDDAEVLYEVDRDSLRLSGDESGELRFRGRLGGAEVEKRIRAAGGRYFIGLEIDAGEAAADRQVAVVWQHGLASGAPTTADIHANSLLVVEDQGLRRYSHQCFFLDSMRGNCHAIEEGSAPFHEEGVRWIAYDGRYFLAALIPKGEAASKLDVRFRNHVASAELLLPPATRSASFDLYLGPKKIEILESGPRSLRPALDLGIFTFIALPLLHVLRLSHLLTGNYGLDIILLTVVIKILFIPLTQKSLKSMREMQKLQPEMAKLRERYKDKPEEMNKQVIELYRRHKVNPLGGCLPMVLQIPVFIGLYQALLNAVELRHAPFVGWIEDLSAPDRLGAWNLPFVEPPGVPILTLLMGASMFLQQWMTPSGADPAQQRMMLIMPVIFTFMFINFPSGLTLYWLVNNVLTIAQQYAINRPGR
jgi:YidC/Oxa1 family membrane protein insertase